MLNPFKFIPCVGGVLLTAALLAFASSPAVAADNAPELSEKTSTIIQPLTTLFEAQKWDEALKTIDGAITKTEPVSYDRAFLCSLKAQIFGSKGDFVSIIEPLEAMLKIADELHLFRFAHALPIGEQEVLISLANFYMQDAQVPNKPLEVQRSDYTKAHIYGRRLADAKKPTVEAQATWARILYYEAMIDPAKVDLTLMKQASVEAEKALHLVIKPKEENFSMLLATLQQLGDNARSAELLELMVQKFPGNKSYWNMLYSTYTNMQGGADKSAELSAIVTLERAQAAGQMLTNKDNFQLAGLYYNIQQYDFAADLLEKGLRNGKIDPEQKNWEILAACYQQMSNDARAIKVFLEAIRLFPKAANLELQVGQIYFNADKHEEAYNHFQAAVKKGLEKPAQTLNMIAYIALEMKRLDEALVATHKWIEAAPKSKDAQALLKVVQDSIDERDKFLKNKK